MLHTTMIDCIGRTPLVQLRSDSRSIVPVYAKLELFNPFGMKDRVAKQSILSAKQSGMLRDGAPIIESSSGTMALGLALVGTYLGHTVHIVTDPRIDPITLIKLKATGCIVHIVPKMTSNGWQSARLERLAELMKEYPDAFWPRQYENPDNPLAYTALAQELLEDLDTVDILVAAVGSGGSLCGTAHALLSSNPNLHVVAVDAAGSAIFGQPDRPSRLQGGLGNSLVPPNVDFSLIDEVHWLNDEEAFAGTIDLAATEKIFAGNSSGSVYVVARWLSRTVADNTRIVALFADRGDRYHSTIYNEHYRLEKGISSLRLPTTPQEVSYTTSVTSWSFSRLKGEQHAKTLARH
jgi:S-sulfo-L-cysteine synthase (3-phospho-L-serine-dependent)